MPGTEPALFVHQGPLARWRLVLLATALSACSWLAALVAGTRASMDADEAVHAVEGLRLFDRLAAGEPSAFLRDSYFPERWQPPVDEHLRWYPCVHAWCLAASFGLLGPTDLAARIPSVIFLFLAVVVFFRLGARLSRLHRGASGLLAGLLLLASPNALTFSAQCLIESASLFTCFLALLLYLRSLEAEHAAGRAALAGAALALAVLTKHDHGGILAVSLVLAELVRARFSPASFARSCAFLFGLPLALLALWFVHPDKRVALLDSLRHPVLGTPRTILLDGLATWFTEIGASLAAGALALGGFVHGARRLRDPALRAVWLWALVGGAFYLARGRFHFRYHYVEAPIFLLLAGVALPEWIERAARALAAPPTRARFRRALAGAAVCVIALGAGLQARRSPAAVYEALRGPLRWFHDLRDDHWGMRLAPEAHLDQLGRTHPELPAYFGGSLAALALGLLLLFVMRGARRSLPPRAARTAAWCALAVATVPGSVRLYRELPGRIEWELESHPELEEMHAFVREHFPGRGTVLLGGGWDQFPNNALRWSLITRSDPRPRFDEVRVVGDMIGSIVFPPEPRIAYWAERLATAPAGELPERVVLVEPGEHFLYHARCAPGAEIYRALLRERGSHRPSARRHFPRLDCTVEVHAREGSAAPIELPRELLRANGLAGGAGSAQRWVGAGGWELCDDALRHFAARALR